MQLGVLGLGRMGANIARRLKLTLAGGGEPLVKPATDHMEAYDLYLQGRFFVEKRGPGLAKGLSLYQQALARDPKFALAHAAVAEVMTLLAVYVVVGVAHLLGEKSVLDLLGKKGYTVERVKP